MFKPPPAATSEVFNRSSNDIQSRFVTLLKLGILQSPGNLVRKRMRKLPNGSLISVAPEFRSDGVFLIEWLFPSVIRQPIMNVRRLAAGAMPTIMRFARFPGRQPVTSPCSV
jgi:hypothetical protein